MVQGDCLEAELRLLKREVASDRDRVNTLVQQYGDFQKDRKELQELIADLQGRREEERKLNTKLFELVDNRLEAVRGLYDVVSKLLYLKFEHLAYLWG